MNITLKQIVEFADILDYSFVVSQLKKEFISVSYCKSSPPKSGSRTVRVERLKEKDVNVEIHKTILHRNGEVTLVTSNGWLRFIK